MGTAQDSPSQSRHGAIVVDLYKAGGVQLAPVHPMRTISRFDIRAFLKKTTAAIVEEEVAAIAIARRRQR